jgi:hypothetical protein
MQTTMTPKTSDTHGAWPDEMRALDFRFAYDTLPDGRVILPITMTVLGMFCGYHSTICVTTLHRIHVYAEGGDA